MAFGRVETLQGEFGIQETPLLCRTTGYYSSRSPIGVHHLLIISTSMEMYVEIWMKQGVKQRELHQRGT